MPHIVVSYAKPILNETNSGGLLKRLHRVASGFETVSAEALKLRACCFDQAWGGASFLDHVHISFQLLAGRSTELKESMAESLKVETEGYLEVDLKTKASVTVEVREFEVYAK